MKVVAESGAYATKEMAETGVKTVINNSINFIKGSSNFKPDGASLLLETLYAIDILEGGKEKGKGHKAFTFHIHRFLTY
jgi:deoxyribose-phosphate aldolase